jgi:hypothetical protein
MPIGQQPHRFLPRTGSTRRHEKRESFADDIFCGQKFATAMMFERNVLHGRKAEGAVGESGIA